jgi:hypothetical protein
MTSSITVHAPSLSTLQAHTQEIIKKHKQWLSAFLINAKLVTCDKSFPMRTTALFWKNLFVKLDYHEYRTKSRGGYRNSRAFITIAPDINRALSSKAYKFKEYSSFANSKVIGSCQGSPQLVFETLLCHELAHAIQFWARATRVSLSKPNLNTAGLTQSSLNPPHGQGFQEIYRALRLALINNQPSYTLLKITTVA